MTFLSEYDADCDIVFMDIQLPDLNGMDAAIKLRKIDDKVTIVFITNLMQYAVDGYQVRALDFIVKPVAYYNFAIKMKRILKERRLNLSYEEELLLSGEHVIKRLAVSAIKYIEVIGHYLTFHTFEGVISTCGFLADMEKNLKDKHFSRCNNCYLVNLKYVTEVSATSCTVDGEELQISRRRRKNFMDDLTMFMGGG